VSHSCGTGTPPSISIIIPNLNSTVVDRTLVAIREQDQDLSSTEVLVVGLDEPELVTEDELVHLVTTEGPVSPAVARNLGIRRAKGEVICLTDADCVPDVDWLELMTEPLIRREADVIGGGVIFTDMRYWTLVDNISWFHEYLDTTRPGPRRLLPTLNICLRRDVIESVGLLNEAYPRAAGEDAEWTTRMRLAGYQLRFVPCARVQHAPPNRSTLRSIWNHAYTYGRYSVKVNTRYSKALGTPVILRDWRLLLILAPLVSFVAALRIFIQDASLWRHVSTLPGIWVSKLAWVLGAANTLRRSHFTLGHPRACLQ
jgi:glycosyltransferase involved in cell wall biosynthesis